MKSGIILSLLFLLVQPVLLIASDDDFTESKSDSLMWETLYLLDDWMYNNLDTAEKYSCELLDSAIAKDNMMMQAEGYAGLGYIHFYRSDPKTALEYFRLSHELYLQLGDSVDIATSHMNFGNVYSTIGLFEKGLHHFQISEKYIPEADNLWAASILAYLYYNTAETFLDLDDHENCELYLKKAEKYVVQDSSFNLMIAIKNIQAELYLREGKLDEAKRYAQLALTQSEELPDIQEKAVALELLSGIAAEHKEYERALNLQKMSLETAMTYEEHDLIAQERIHFAERLLDLERYNEALDYAHQAYTFADTIGSQILIKASTLVLSQIYEASKDYEEALKFIKIHHQAKDSLASVNLHERILESQTELTAKENELLNTKMKFQDQVIHQNRFILLGIATALLLSLVLIIILIQSLKRKRKSQRLIEEKRKLINNQSKELQASNEALQQLNKNKDKLFSILTHDLKQPFNQTITLLEIIQSYDIEDEELMALINQVKEATAETKDTVDNLLTWSKAQFANIKTNPKPVLLSTVSQHLQQEFKQAIADKELQCLFNINPDTAVFSDPNHLEIILRNLFQNAIKFSNIQGRIQLEASKHGDKVTVLLKDEGTGMTQEQINHLFDANIHFSTPGTLNEKGTGLGMLIVNDFVKENKGTIEVESAVGKGTIFKVSLPAA